MKTSVRTKSLLFDDDVVETFGKEGMNFTIDEIIARYYRGGVSRDVTRRGISQCMTALVALDVRQGGWDTDHMMAMMKKVVREYPEIYAED